MPKRLRRTFQRYFPAGHDRQGEETFFVEKLINWYWETIPHSFHNVTEMLLELNGEKFSREFIEEFNDGLNPDISDWKSHTIREKHHFAKGDLLSPAVWTGKPYNSSQLRILPDLIIPKVWDFKKVGDECFINGWDKPLKPVQLERIARNDGLTLDEFKSWFSQPEFDGQIICWNPLIEY